MKKGFTLIELILYISLLTFILNIGVFFVWQIIEAKIKNIAYLEVEKNLILALEKVSYEAKRAKSLEVPKIQGQETKELVLKRSDDSQIRFYLSDGRLVFDSPDNPTPIFITNEKIKIDELIFENLSSVSPGTFQIRIKISYNNPSKRSEYQAEISSQKTISLRDNLVSP